MALLPSLALFGGLYLDLGLCCAWSGKSKNKIVFTLYNVVCTLSVLSEVAERGERQGEQQIQQFQEKAPWL